MKALYTGFLLLLVKSCMVVSALITCRAEGDGLTNLVTSAILIGSLRLWLYKASSDH
mgnify:FL=1